AGFDRNDQGAGTTRSRQPTPARPRFARLADGTRFAPPSWRGARGADREELEDAKVAVVVRRRRRRDGQRLYVYRGGSRVRRRRLLGAAERRPERRLERRACASRGVPAGRERHDHVRGSGAEHGDDESVRPRLVREGGEPRGGPERERDAALG